MEPAPLKKICTNQLLVPLDLRNEGRFMVYIRIGEEPLFQVPVFAEFSIANVKEEIANKVGLGSGEMVLVFAGKILHDGMTISQSNISKESTLYLFQSKKMGN